MSHRLFVASGLPHAGLDRLAQVLTALGAPCGHEDIFHTAAFERGGTLFWPPTHAGDASWYAAPVLAKLPSKSVVLHQVSDPLATIEGLLRDRFFEEDTPARAFVQDFIPETRKGGPVVQCMRFWLHWNRMIETAADFDDLTYRRLRREDFDATRASETVALLGLLRNRSTAQEVLDGLPAVPCSERPRLNWSDLPTGRLRLDLEDAARDFGYVPASIGG